MKISYYDEDDNNGYYEGYSEDDDDYYAEKINEYDEYTLDEINESLKTQEQYTNPRISWYNSNDDCRNVVRKSILAWYRNHIKMSSLDKKYFSYTLGQHNKMNFENLVEDFLSVATADDIEAVDADFIKYFFRGMV